jgi:uncharacterized protein (TIGR03066 family)
MKTLRLVLSGCLILGLASVSAAGDKPKPPAKDEKKDDKKDTKEFKEKIVGTWVVVEDNAYEKGTLITFNKDGKSNFKPKGEKKGVDGTYKVDGDKLTMTVVKITTPPWTIEKITDDELLMKDIGGGKVRWTRK